MGSGRPKAPQTRTGPTLASVKIPCTWRAGAVSARSSLLQPTTVRIGNPGPSRLTGGFELFLEGEQ